MSFFPSFLHFSLPCILYKSILYNLFWLHRCHPNRIPRRGPQSTASAQRSLKKKKKSQGSVECVRGGMKTGQKCHFASPENSGAPTVGGLRHFRPFHLQEDGKGVCKGTEREWQQKQPRDEPAALQGEPKRHGLVNLQYTPEVGYTKRVYKSMKMRTELFKLRCWN